MAEELDFGMIFGVVSPF